MSADMQEVQVYFSPAPHRSSPVGVLALHNHRLYFEYDPSWLKTGLELSPFVLPAQSGLFEHTNYEFGPLFGLFDDSLPDGWGLLLMDWFFRRKKLEPTKVSPLDRLLYLGKNTMGALTYHPPANLQEDGVTRLDLYDLAAQARAVYEGSETEVLPLLLRTGGSPGGARPKVLIGYDCRKQIVVAGEGDLPPGFEPWLVKFSAREDGLDAGPVEFAYALMAKAAGIIMPENRIFHAGKGDRFFGVKRFDRLGANKRRHIHTFGNLIEANFRLPVCDYHDLFKVASLLTRNHEDILHVFRLMVFNVLAHNRDDHVKNFSFILDDNTGQWFLAPAYDLTFSSGPGGEHSTTVDGHGREIKSEQCLRLAAKHDITAQKAAVIIKEVNDAVGQWPDFAGEAKVSAQQTLRISEVLRAVRKTWGIT